MVIVTVLALPVLGRDRAPHVVPGQPARLLRELAVKPFRFRIYDQAGERFLACALAEGAAGRGAQWATLGVGGGGLGGNPYAFVVDVSPIDARRGDLFVVHITTAKTTDARWRSDSRYLVRRVAAKPRLVCRLPGGPVELSILAVTPDLAFSLVAGKERIRYVVRGDDLCRMEVPSLSTPTSADNLLYNATLTEGAMFRGVGRWKEAGDAFQRALRLRPAGAEAEAVAIEAIRMRASYSDFGWSDPEDPREVAVDGVWKLLLESYDDYLRRFPQTEMSASVRYRKAGLLQTRNHLEEAARLYKEVFEGFPDHALSSSARGAYAELVQRIRRREHTRPQPEVNTKPSMQLR